MFNVQPVQQSDLLALEQLLSALKENMLNVGLESWDVRALQRYLKNCLGIWQPDNALVGFLIFHPSVAATELLLLATGPGYQRRGVARHLMNEWLKTASRPIWLEVHEANTAAKSLYFSLGFQEVGRRRRYYRDGGAAISMSLI